MLNVLLFLSATLYCLSHFYTLAVLPFSVIFLSAFEPWPLRFTLFYTSSAEHY